MVPNKLLDKIKAHIQDVASQKTEIGKSLWQELLKLHPVDIAQFLSGLEDQYFKELFLNLPQGTIEKVFAELKEATQRVALSFFDHNKSSDILNSLKHDQLNDLLDSLSDEDLQKYISLIHRKDRGKLLSLLKFGPESAGSIMDEDVISLNDDFTVAQSITLLQRLTLTKELYRKIFVVDENQHLIGHIKLEDLFLQDPKDSIKVFTKENAVIAQVNDDRETVAYQMKRYNEMIVPVVGDQNYFLGVIPGKVLVDILGEERDEDIYTMAGAPVIKGTYFEQSFFKVLYQRSYILIILLLAQSISSMIIQHNEALLAGFLVVFITMLISTGGNTSSQTSAVIIQGMASGEITQSNMMRFFRREFSLAFAMAIILGLTAFARVYLTSGNMLGSLAVSTSLASIVVVSVVVGSIIPVILKRIGMDPAHAAGPLLATLMDILGLLIYCSVSQFFLFS